MLTMSDWFGALSPEDRSEWDRFVDHTREHTARGMAESAFVMSLAPKGKPDIKFAVELGLAIMLGKPLLVVQMPGTEVPPKLRQVADLVVMADLDTEDGQRLLAAKVKKFMDALPDPA
jgi:hypothetical protein